VKLKKSQQNLRNWTKQDWRTGSGKKSSETGEAYFPAAAVAALKKAGLYDDAVRTKKAASRSGKNAVYPERIRKIVRRFR
jgi:hypothetical protein